MATKYAARGTVFKRGATTIALVRNIGGIGKTLNLIDATSHEDAIADYVAGIIDGNDISLEMGFDPADSGHQGLLDDLEARTKGSYSIVWPSPAAGTVAFSGFVTHFENTANFDGLLVAAVTIKPSGSATWTP